MLFNSTFPSVSFSVFIVKSSKIRFAIFNTHINING